MDKTKETIITIIIIIFFLGCGVGIYFLASNAYKNYIDSTTTAEVKSFTTTEESTTIEETTTQTQETNKTPSSQKITTTVKKNTTTTTTRKVKLSDILTTTQKTTKVKDNSKFNFYKTTFTIPSGYGYGEGNLDGYGFLQIAKSNSTESITFFEDHDEDFSNILKDMTEANSYAKSLGCGSLTKKTINSKTYLYSTCTKDGTKYIFAITSFPDGIFEIIYNSNSPTYDNFSSLIGKLNIIN